MLWLRRSLILIHLFLWLLFFCGKIYLWFFTGYSEPFWEHLRLFDLANEAPRLHPTHGYCDVTNVEAVGP